MWEEILQGLGAAARGAAQGRGVRVLIKTNLGPAFTVYDHDDPGADGPGFLKAGVMIQDRNGQPIGKLGTIPQTDWLVLGAILAVVGAGVFLMVRGVVKK